MRGSDGGVGGRGRKESIRATERRNPRTRGLDRLSTLGVVRRIQAEDARVAPAVARQARAIARAADLAADALREGGRVVYVGAGTSGRLGVLDASECPPTFGVDAGRVVGVIAGGPRALVRSREGVEDDRTAGARAIDRLGVGPRDFVLGIAASGTTPFVRAALSRARTRGARVGFLTCSDPDEGIRRVADVLIVPRVGAEAIAGSTRMKAGTATKLALNAISTAAMVRLGRVYDNLMVDLGHASRKLRDRAERIVMEATGVARGRARVLLREAGGKAKTAAVMGLLGVSAPEADAYLDAGEGFVRRAVDLALREAARAGRTIRGPLAGASRAVRGMGPTRPTSSRGPR